MTGTFKVSTAFCSKCHLEKTVAAHRKPPPDWLCWRCEFGLPPHPEGGIERDQAVTAVGNTKKRRHARS